MVLRLLVFLLINFGALAIGAQFTGKGVSSEWYAALNKAPWSPPGWTFGVAWTTIMICFAIYMAISWNRVSNQKLLLGLFIIQFILNVSWNPVFFYFQNPAFGLAIIAGLTLVMIGFLFYFRQETQQWSLLVLPYVLWLLIATSLNGYIVYSN